MLVFAARERKINAHKCGGRLAEMQHTTFGGFAVAAKHLKGAR
jgi:hypothetical protein